MDEENKETLQAEETEDCSSYRKLLVFSVEDKTFSVDSERVEEIVNDTEVFSIPFVPECVEGVINLRGQPVTVYNPFTRGIKGRTHCNILKFKDSGEAFGIKISKVESFTPENKTDGIEELNADKMKSDLRKALGYEND